jgi:hypothetical protein
MNRLVLAALLASLAVPALAQDNPFGALRGKVREGNWEYKIQMEGVPMPPITMTRCLSTQDVDKGGFAARDGKMPDGCSVKNFGLTGTGATWTMECTKQPKMTVNSTMTFGGDSWSMKQDMTMEQNGKPMHMVQNLTGRYLGACDAAAPKK